MKYKLSRLEWEIIKSSRELKTRQDGAVKDVIYLVGVSIDKKLYGFHDGFDRFMEYIKKLKV